MLRQKKLDTFAAANRGARFARLWRARFARLLRGRADGVALLDLSLAQHGGAPGGKVLPANGKLPGRIMDLQGSG